MNEVLVSILCLCIVSFGGFVEAGKIDCYPIDGAAQDKCEYLGCKWEPVHSELAPEESVLPFEHGHETVGNIPGGIPSASAIREPWCYFPDDYEGYEVINLSANKVKLVRKRASALGQDVSELLMDVEPLDSKGHMLRLKIYDPNKKRFEPKLPELNYLSGLDTSSSELQFNHHVERNIYRITRRSTGAIIFETDLRKLIFSEQFMQINTKLDSPYLYGLGEHYDTFLKKVGPNYKTYSFFNTDKTPLPEGRRSYGGIPFFVNLDSNLNNAHGVYLHNSNGMDVIIQPDNSVTFRPIGGVLDFIFFIGPTPNDVISQFQHLVGLPSLPPLWSLGFHLCRYNYGSLEKTRLVWQRTRDAGIPFDVQWNDIDYMDRHNDFTYDNNKFAGLPEFVKNSIHANNMHYMILFDPGLSQEDNYYPYSLGMDMDIFVKNASNGVLVGKVWNDSGRTVFPDFSNPKALDYWTKLFKKFQQELPFDGAWIDMNDISNFVVGSLDGCPNDNRLEQPPYQPGGYPLQTNTLCLSAKHQDGNEYDIHNIYCFYEAVATYKALQESRPNKRPFVISRSTAPGQNRFGGHWSGDLLSNWDYLRWTVPSLIEYSMYGYSMMGSDICGFIGNTNPQLCARWSTLGAFYTFSRNHNDDVSIDQDPVAMGPEVVRANLNAQTNRYALLPFLYTLIHRASMYGESVIRSIPFEFHTTDPEALNVEYQFMWGRALMISPIVYENTYSKRTFLPKGRWYGSDIVLRAEKDSLYVPKWIDSKGEYYETNNVSLSDLPIFYRGGHTIPVYVNVLQTVAETVRNQPFALRVFLCEKMQSSGELIFDHGDNTDGKHNHIEMDFKDNKLTISQNVDDYMKEVPFGRVAISGVASKVSSIKLNGNTPISFKRNDHVISFDLGGIKVSKSQPIIVELFE